MPNGRRRESPEPPDWWSLSLYDFLSDLPVQGWIWEFMRRARLKEVLKEAPVDAMNPKPELEGIDPHFWNYYKSYDKLKKKQIVFFPPAVIIPGKWDKGFHGQQYTISDEDLRKMAEVRVDLNRPNSVIMRDFEAVLMEFRKSFSKPRRISPRIHEWAQNRTLQIWDLRQFNVTWERVADLVLDENDEGGIDKVRNAYKVSIKYIDRGEWKYLARYVEPE